MERARDTELLRQAGIFAELDDQTLDIFAARARRRTVRKGQLIFTQGDPGHSLFVVAEGLVKVYVLSEDGDQAILATLSECDVFGEISLIDGGPRSASAEAAQDTTLLELAREPFLELIRENPQMAESVLCSLGHVLRRLTEQTADLVFLDLPGRVAKLLLQLASESGADSPDGTVLTGTLTQGDLASMVGGTRQSVNQALNAFARRGSVDLDGGRIVIKDVAALRRRAGL